MAACTIDGERHSVEHVYATDLDPNACATYARNIHGGESDCVEHGDIRDKDLATLPDFDGMAFGFPCNDFSIVGETRGIEGKYGPLYTYCVDAVRIKNPKWFVAENVSGLQGANGGDAFEAILKAFGGAGEGYELTTHLYKFEDYGVPQKRHRILIVGIRKDLDLKFQVPAPTTPTSDQQVTAMQALSGISADAANHDRTNQAPQVVARLKEIPEGKNAWWEDLPKEHQLNVKGARLSSIYRRLDRNKPAYTVTGSGGGGTHMYHWEEPRALTNRERARLQTFPDDYVFEGVREKVRKQIGMAVPPAGAKVVFRALLKTLAGQTYASVPPKWGGVLSERQLTLL